MAIGCPFSAGWGRGGGVTQIIRLYRTLVLCLLLSLYDLNILFVENQKEDVEKRLFQQRVCFIEQEQVEWRLLHLHPVPSAQILQKKY
jgi:hypothetical protein